MNLAIFDQENYYDYDDDDYDDGIPTTKTIRDRQGRICLDPDCSVVHLYRLKIIAKSSKNCEQLQKQGKTKQFQPSSRLKVAKIG